MTAVARRARLWGPAALAIAAAALPAAGPATAATGSGAAELSPRLSDLARPAVRKAPRTRQAARLSVAPSGPGSLLRDGDRVFVDVRFERGAAAAQDALRAAGGRVVHVSARYQTVTVAARPADLPRLGAVSGVAGVTEILTPMVSGNGCAGLVTSEGDWQLRAADARASFNLDGSGATVGVLSDSFDADAEGQTDAAGDVLSGDLPGPGNPCGRALPVDVLEDAGADGGEDEGRAMAQIVHDLAPGAALSFATGFAGELSFADNIRRLAAAGATTIVDDISYFEEPFFQDGPVAVAVNDVTAAGVDYFTAAGNNNVRDAAGRDIASWEAPEFRDAPACPPEVEPLLVGATCMDFDPGARPDPTFGITVAAGSSITVDLQWAEPWNGVETDLDAILLDSGGKPLEAAGGIVGGATDNVGGSQRPVEVFQWTNETDASAEVQLLIARSGAGMPRLKFALLSSDGVTATEYAESRDGDVVGPTVFGHNGAASAVSVAAVPYDDSSRPEDFSSHGPVVHRFGPVTGTAPAPPLERTLIKPDLAATDCNRTTFFVPDPVPGTFRFCGTSAAAPHAAAVAALMHEANLALSFEQFRAALGATARPVGAFGPDAVGAGLIDAHAAVARIALPPAVAIVERPPALGRDRWPMVTFAASRPASFACSLDGGPLKPCASPWFPSSRLRDGVHGFAVRATDAAGRTGQSETVMFDVDRTRPRVFIPKRPRKVVRTRHRRAKIVFRFRSNERGARFVCKVDGNLWRFCRKRIGRRMGAGKHVLRVRARDLAGNVTRKPVAYRFQVKRRR